MPEPEGARVADAGGAVFWRDLVGDGTGTVAGTIGVGLTAVGCRPAGPEDPPGVATVASADVGANTTGGSPPHQRSVPAHDPATTAPATTRASTAPTMIQRGRPHVGP